MYICSVVAAKKIVRIALLALVSISTFSGVPGLSSFVLCLGKDGHLELEYSVDGKCGSAAKAGASAFRPSETESHCGTCTDISLMERNGNTLRPAGADTPRFQAVAVFSCFIGVYLERTATGMPPQPQPSYSPHLTHLRTVRILV